MCYICDSHKTVPLLGLCGGWHKIHVLKKGICMIILIKEGANLTVVMHVKNSTTLIDYFYLRVIFFSSTLQFCFILAHLPIHRDRGMTSLAIVAELRWLCILQQCPLHHFLVPHALPRPCPEVQSVSPSFEARGLVTISTKRRWWKWCYVTSGPRS